jgi:hypothetical protein
LQELATVGAHAASLLVWPIAGKRVYGFSTGAPTRLPHSVHEPS